MFLFHTQKKEIFDKRSLRLKYPLVGLIIIILLTPTSSIKSQIPTYTIDESLTRVDIDSVGFFTDTLMVLTYDQINIEEIKSRCTPLSKHTPRINYWQFFKLRNLSYQKVLVDICSHRSNIKTIYSIGGSSTDTIEQGSFSRLENIKDLYCVQIDCSPQEVREVIILQNRQMHSRGEVSTISICSEEYSEKYYENILESERISVVGGEISTSIIAFIFVFWFANFIFNQESYLTYYLLYVFSMFLFYFRNIEISKSLNILFSYIPHLNNYIELDLTYVIFLSYMMFMKRLFKIQRTHKMLWFIIEFSIYITCILFITSLVVQLLSGFYYSFLIFNSYRIFLAVSIPSMMILIGYYIRSIPSTLIVLGAIIFFIPSVFTAIMQILEWHHIRPSGLFLRHIGISGKFTISIYHGRIGLILELLFFSAAMGYQQRKDRLEYAALMEEIIHLRVIRKQKNLEKKIKASNKSDLIATKVRTLIEGNISNDEYSIEKLCDDLGLSRGSLHKHLAHASGLSTSFFIRAIRLERAEYLLKTSNKNINEIAFEIGFKDASYFGNVFKQSYSLTPQQWRKKHNYQNGTHN